MAINSLSASSYGLSGLVSGINSEDMVKKLLSGTQSKIDKTMQKKTVLEYKQQMYRDVANKLKTLQSSYLSFTSKTNLLSNSFFNTMTASVNTLSGKAAAFSVTASSAATLGTHTMQSIEQLASAYTMKTTSNASQAVGATFDKTAVENLLGKYEGDNAKMVISVGADSVTIDDVMAQFGGQSTTAVASIINTAFAEKGIDATANFINNKLQITAGNADAQITVQGSGWATDRTQAMKMFGSSVSVLSGKGTFSAAVDTDAYLPSITVNLDGRQQNIAVSLKDLRTFARGGENGEGGDATDLMTSLSDSLSRVFGTGVKLTQNGDGSGFSLTTGQASQRVTVTGDYRVMGAFGMTSGISNKLNTTLAVRDLNFSTQLQGNQQTFSINGVGFSYDSSASLGTIINDINNSKAGVKVSYIESEDRFVIQKSETGAVADDFEFKFDQTSGNLLSAMFGVKGGSEAVGYGVNMTMTSNAMSAETKKAINYGGTYTFNVNGTDYKFNVPWSEGNALITPEKFAEKMNATFASTFGYQADGTQIVSFKLEDGKFSIHSNDSNMVIKAVKQDADTNKDLLGFSVGQSTRATSGSITLAQAGISFGTGTAAGLTINLGSESIRITADDIAQYEADNGPLTMDSLAGLINSRITEKLGASDTNPSVKYDAKTAAYRVMGVDIPMEIVVTKGADSKNLDNLFGRSSIAINQDYSANGLSVMTEGKNAVFTLDGSKMERSTNTFTVDGLTYTLHATTYTDQAAQSGGHELPTQVVVSRDTEKIVDGIQEFLKMYNETFDYINNLLRADPVYKDYAPLTTEQKEKMSDREVELWEKKSQEGLLRNDQYLERILSSMRSVMYSKPEGSSIAIYDLGISTSFYTNTGNLNASNPNDLRAAIEANPEAVQKLFSGEGGIMEQLNDAISNATRSSFSTPGYLVQVAGSSTVYTDSTIYKQVTELDKQLVTLENRYWKEYDRYWKQFNSMEQMIQNMNNQSSWLSQLSS